MAKLYAQKETPRAKFIGAPRVLDNQRDALLRTIPPARSAREIKGTLELYKRQGMSGHTALVRFLIHSGYSITHVAKLTSVKRNRVLSAIDSGNRVADIHRQQLGVGIVH